MQRAITNCKDCPLNRYETFRILEDGELNFVSRFKTGEMTVNPGGGILLEQSHSAHLFTVLSGWAFRYKMLEDGRRQILNFLLPGDLVGLQGTLLGEMDHSVEALSEVVLCVFERNRIYEIFRKHPGLAFDVTWIASREERILDENLLSVGRRTALERASYLLAYLTQRARSVGMIGQSKSVKIPITQQHVADTLGLSIVHTNKTLRKLARRSLIRWGGRLCEVLDEAQLREIAGWHGLGDQKRPFI